MKNIKLTIEKSRCQLGGYTIRHDQPLPFNGIVGHTFGWYKFKRDAIARANELTICWNKEKQPA